MTSEISKTLSEVNAALDAVNSNRSSEFLNGSVRYLRDRVNYLYELTDREENEIIEHAIRNPRSNNLREKQ